jgi:tetratricopeptide (TPR) repeat protein
VWLLRARTRKAAGDYEEAEADFLRAAKLYPPNTQRGRTLIETAEAATQSGQLAKAKSLLDRAETQCDLDSLARNEAATLRGWVYMDEGRVREAAAILRSVAKDAEQPGAWRDPRNEGRTHSLLGKVRIELEWNAAPPTELRPSSPGALAGAQERLRIAARELERADPLWHISNGLWATIADILAAPHAGTDRKSELENIRSAYGRDSHRAQAELALARYRLIRDPADLKARDLYESALTVFVEEGKHPKRVATIGLDLAAALRQKGKVRAREIADLLVLTLLAHPYPGHRTSRAAATKLGLALTEIPNIDDYLESLKGRVDAGEGHFRWLQLLPPVEKRGLILAKVSEVARRKRR